MRSLFSNSSLLAARPGWYSVAFTSGPLAGCGSFGSGLLTACSIARGWSRGMSPVAVRHGCGTLVVWFIRGRMVRPFRVR